LHASNGARTHKQKTLFSYPEREFFVVFRVNCTDRKKARVFARILMRAKTQMKKLSRSDQRVVFFQTKAFCGTLKTVLASAIGAFLVKSDALCEAGGESYFLFILSAAF